MNSFIKECAAKAKVMLFAEYGLGKYANYLDMKYNTITKEDVEEAIRISPEARDQLRRWIDSMSERLEIAREIYCSVKE